MLHKNFGTKKFFKELLKIDPLVKNQINPSDTQRSINTYDLKVYTKTSMYPWFKHTKTNNENNDFYKIYITIHRQYILKNIYIMNTDMIDNKDAKDGKK